MLRTNRSCSYSSPVAGESGAVRSNSLNVASSHACRLLSSLKTNSCSFCSNHNKRNVQKASERDGPESLRCRNQRTGDSSATLLHKH